MIVAQFPRLVPLIVSRYNLGLQLVFIHSHSRCDLVHGRIFVDALSGKVWGQCLSGLGSARLGVETCTKVADIVSVSVRGGTEL